MPFNFSERLKFDNFIDDLVSQNTKIDNLVLILAANG